MSDLWLFIITIALLVVTVGAAVMLGMFSGGLRTRARDVVGTTIVLGVLFEFTFVIILSEHFLEQFKSH
jgi:hypothetical protein